MGTAAETRPVEAQFQDEFYPVCYYVLDKTVYLTSEWTGSTSSGRIDFQIKAVRWAIECCRGSDRLDETHLQIPTRWALS